MDGNRTQDQYSLRPGGSASSPCFPATSTCTATYGYDPRDRLVSNNDGHGDVTTYGLDGAGDIQTQSTVNASGTTTVSNTYNGQRWQPVAAPRPRRSTGGRVLLIVGIVMAVLPGFGGISILGYNVLLRLDASSGSGAPLPAAFPTDFPLYHPAALELMSSEGSGTNFECGGQWLTTDSLDKVLRFYEQKLSVADWEHGPVERQSLHARMPFRRASDRSYGGVLTLDLNWLNQVVTIEVVTKPHYCVMKPHYWRTGQ